MKSKGCGCGCAAGDGKTIKMPAEMFVKEHKDLIKTLKSGSPAMRLQEAKSQARELKKYLTSK